MLRYDISSGVKKIKTKTAIIASATVLGISGLGMAVVVPAISNAAGPTSCNSGHGAPGGVSGDVKGENGGALPNGNPAPSAGSNFGQEQGSDTTGFNNSNLAAICRNS